jgi:DNA-binding GntR family transcriptional regulator
MLFQHFRNTIGPLALTLSAYNVPECPHGERWNGPADPEKTMLSSMSKKVPSLVKSSVAERLREQISGGRLQPGMRIVESTWAQTFGVAQASVREAIHLLIAEGLVTKESGRSACVISLAPQELLGLYELRGVIEGLAVRLVTRDAIDTTSLRQALTQMVDLQKVGRFEDLLDAELEFHLDLCRLSGNTYVLEHARRVLLPLFAFARTRLLTLRQDAVVSARDLDAHQRLLDLIRDGHPEVAEQYVRHMMARTAASPSSGREGVSPAARRPRARRASATRKA